MNINPIKLTLKALFAFSLFILLTNCGIWDPADARKIDPNAQKRAEKNLKEGKGFRLNDALKNRGSGSFEFATSNEMWRATLSLLDFTPLSNVDYSGGIIITEWFSDKNSKNESIKITVRFLSNEIRADGINIIVHKKICLETNNCEIKKIDSTISQDIKLAILKKATRMKENERVKDPDYKIPKFGKSAEEK